MIVAHIELADDHAQRGQAHKAIIHHQTKTKTENREWGRGGELESGEKAKN